MTIAVVVALAMAALALALAIRHERCLPKIERNGERVAEAAERLVRFNVQRWELERGLRDRLEGSE